MTSGRIRAVIWVLLFGCFAVWTWRSFRVCDAAGGPIGFNAMGELISWKGTMAFVVSFDSWSGGAWRVWQVPQQEGFLEILEFLVRVGVRFVEQSGTTGIVFGWPIATPLIVAFLGIEGTRLLRRRKLPVDAAPDAGIAERHE